MVQNPSVHIRSGNALLWSRVPPTQHHLTIHAARKIGKTEAPPTILRFTRRAIPRQEFRRKMGRRLKQLPGCLLVLLAQVVPLDILPESLSHLGGGNLLSFPSTQNSGQGRVQFDTIAPERRLLTYRQLHLPRTYCHNLGNAPENPQCNCRDEQSRYKAAPANDSSNLRSALFMVVRINGRVRYDSSAK